MPEESSSRLIMKKNDRKKDSQKKRVVFDGVEIPLDRSRKEMTIASSSKAEEVPKTTSENKRIERIEVELSDSEDEETSRTPAENKKLYEPDQRRPFDKVPQIMQRPKGKGRDVGDR